MAKFAGYSLDINLLPAITNWDTIIFDFYGWISDIDPWGMSNVNSICVKAVFWCTNCKVVESKILTPQKINMKLFAVSWSYVLDHAIGDEVEPQILL